VVWFLVEWPSTEAPTDYWLSTQPEDTLITTLVRLGTIRWRSSMTTANSRTGWGWIIPRAGAGLVDITTRWWSPLSSGWWRCYPYCSRVHL